MLRRLTLPVARISDFDQLPTPFRAVATDLESGETVVMGSGDLTSAMHASLSAPAVFAPVQREGHLLVDGASPTTSRSTSRAPWVWTWS